jgi:phage repressor protein C with HTH and peptisase S24 domain
MHKESYLQGNKLTYRFVGMNTLGLRLKAARAKARLTQRELAEATGVSQPLISQIEKGKNASSADLPKLARACGVDTDWLADGIGSMEPGEPSEADAPSDKDYALIPQYTALGECGNGYLNDHAEIKGGLAFKRDWLAKMKVKPENLCVIYASGASMEPYVMEGDVVLFDQSDITPRDRQVYAIRRPDGDISIKRLVLGLTGSWIIRSDNPNKSDYPDEALSADAVHEMPIIGRVIWRGGGMI